MGNEIERTVVLGADEVREPTPPLDALLLFAGRAGGRFSAQAGQPYGWQVSVEWHSIGEGNRRIFAEDKDFTTACMLCRGLLAHSLASGVATL